MISEKKKLVMGIMYGAIAGILWGTLGIFLSLILNTGLSYVAVSSLAPMIVIFFFGFKTIIKDKCAFYIGRKRLVILLVGGGIANAILYYSYARALGYLSTGIFSILEFSHVFALVILSSIIFKYKITKGKILAIFVAILGLAFILNVFSSDNFVSPLGIVWMVINWLGNCSVALIIKWSLENEVQNDVVITYLNLGSALIFWVVCPPWAVVTEIINVPDIMQLLLIILGYAVFTQIISIYAWVKSFSLVDPAITNMMTAFSPITTIILGYIIFAEVISIWQILGIAIVILAVYILSKSDGEKQEY